MNTSKSSALDNGNSLYDAQLNKRYFWDKIFATASWAAVAFSILVLIVLLIDVVHDGLPRLDWTLLSEFPSRRPAEAGLKSALIGTIWLMSITAIITFPLGVGAGIFLEEFSTDNIFTKIIDININNLAAVPSIIYGLLGLEIFVRVLEPITGGRSVLAGSMTLSLLILPIVIVSTREALKAVPDSLRQAGLALGATKWQVVREQIFPLALPGILTGTILALSRAIGETAPLITIGALTFIAFLPPLGLEGLQTPFTALPIQIFNWVSRPQTEFHTAAAAGIIVLMCVLLFMNGTAIFLRNKFQK
ncbi:phosphate ABC transporter membrane protein 2, PhoT family [[Leptolyngbya] sp. PCC 7376]|uniref:phosphate ABC transporter permease PstA n=1 Tax=[Leptolyngbya] sp. PCC 7376 TaxID=111781 RepID=UPI00029ECA56|nr:phosphate ABC transporter permease PstA [[Leptolyngbya] sp. PCC 7376]AFY39136.1 phosphate ABC transporter membrane protein 2, PhoT family [[Leptolyngbya] sp. PCC 7376]